MMMMKANIHSLPPELIERTLIFTVATNSPSSIANFSETCHQFYDLVHHPTDTHLWRQVFLVMFDDPREAGRVLGKKVEGYDWKGEFMKRMYTIKFMKYHTTKVSSPQAPVSWGISLEGILETLISLVETSLPFPVMPGYYTNTQSEMGNNSPPTFPITLFLCTPPNFFPSVLKSKNAARLDQLLANGWPNEFRQAIMPSSFPYRPPSEKVGQSLFLSPSGSRDPIFGPLRSGGATDEGADRISQQCHRRLQKLAFDRGASFILHPILSRPQQTLHPNKLWQEFGSKQPKRFGNASHNAGESSSSSSQLAGDDRTAAAQRSEEDRERMRFRARKVVYNLKYLRKDRLWGPFLPLPPAPPTPRQPTSPSNKTQEVDEQMHQGDVTGDGGDETSFHLHAHEELGHEGDGVIDTVMSELEEAVKTDSVAEPADQLLQPSEISPQGWEALKTRLVVGDDVDSEEDEYVGDEDSETDDDENDPLNIFNLIDFGDPTPHAPSEYPSNPLLVIPDYHFLAAARVLVEENLQELLSRDDYLASDEDDEDDDDGGGGNEGGEQGKGEGGMEGGRQNSEEGSDNGDRVATPNSDELIPLLNIPGSGSQMEATTYIPTPSQPIEAHIDLEGSSPPSTQIGEDVSSSQGEIAVVAMSITSRGATQDPRVISRTISESLGRRLGNHMRRHLVASFRSSDLLRMGAAPGFSWVGDQDDENGYGSGESSAGMNSPRGKGRQREEGTGGGSRIGWTDFTRKQCEEDNRKDRDGESLGDDKLRSDKGKGKQKALDDGSGVDLSYPGWDWAGVEGEWRRAVCWMDYRDLLVHNVRISNVPSPAYDAGDLTETIRLFPMTLRIIGYSPPPRHQDMINQSDGSTYTTHPLSIPTNIPVDSLVYKLPIIHFEGSQGSMVDPISMRRMRGSVRMIGEGAIRWNMLSKRIGTEEPEWASEGVQMGSIGSAVGFVGIWTGAEHLRSDPIGPFMAWKVAQKAE